MTSGFQCQSLIIRAALSRFMILTKFLHLNYGLVFNTKVCIILYTMFKYKEKQHGRIRIYDSKV